jgi:secreted trypsin-like serine protease
VGVVSWGEVPLDALGPCGNPQLYGYYTRLSHFKPWMEEVMATY